MDSHNSQIKIKNHVKYSTIVCYGWPKSWPSIYNLNLRVVMINAHARRFEKIGITVQFLLELSKRKVHQIVFGFNQF